MTCLQNAVSTDKGFARIPSLDELAAQYTSSKDLSSLLKNTKVRPLSCACLLAGAACLQHLADPLLCPACACLQHRAWVASPCWVQAAVKKITDDTQKSAGDLYVKFITKAQEKVCCVPGPAAVHQSIEEHAAKLRDGRRGPATSRQSRPG